MGRWSACSALVVIALTVAPLGAQEKKDKKEAAKPAPKVISLSGCVVRGEKTTDPFVLEDKTEGRYRLSGINLRDYLGQRVELAGGEVQLKKLTVKGGLYPTPNVAAQAGSMDPARAAVAGATGAGSTGTGTVELPEFRVKSVRPVSGGCPD